MRLLVPRVVVQDGRLSVLGPVEGDRLPGTFGALRGATS